MLKERFRQFPFHFYHAQRERYLELAHVLNIKVIDTRQPLKKTVDEILVNLEREIPMDKGSKRV